MTTATRRAVLGRSSQEKILFASLFTKGLNDRWGVPLVLVGPPGGVKTSTIRQVNQMAGLHNETVISSLREPTDFLGLGVPKDMILTEHTQHLSPDGDASIKVMNYCPPDFAIRAALAKRATITLDEVNTSAPAVQAALLRFVNEGVCGELQMPPECRFLLAMNETEDAAGGWDIAPSLANRMGWLNWDAPDVGMFQSYLMGGGKMNIQPVNAAAEEAAVNALWTEAFARAAGDACGFLNAKPDGLHRKPAAGSPGASRAWPSHRTWDLAIRARAAGYIYDLSPREIANFVGAFIGDAALGEWNTWLKHADLPDPTAFLDGQVAFSHQPARLDRTAALLTAATGVVVNGGRDGKPGSAQLNAKRAETLWAFHEGLSAQAPDLSLGSVVELCTARLMTGSQTAYRVLAKMEPVMTAAGITPSSVK